MLRDLTKRTLLEHTIVAPFDGVVIERMKHPGESVRANEAVVRLGNLDKLRVFGYVPLDFAFAVKEGAIVEFQARVSGSRTARLPIEQRKFRGKITFVDPQIQPVITVGRQMLNSMFVRAIFYQGMERSHGTGEFENSSDSTR